MPATRSALLKSVKAAGYDGAADLPSIKTWATNQNIEIPDLEASWNTAKTLTLDPEDAPPPRDRSVGEIGKSVAQVNSSADRVLSPASTRRMAEQKIYNHRAKQGRTLYGDADTAERMGAYLRLVGFDNKGYPERNSDMEILGKSFLSTNPISGADFVPEEFVPEVIRLVQTFGAYAKAHSPRPIASTQMSQPKRTSGLTVVYPGEGQTITESSSTTQIVGCQTKDGYTITDVSLTELEASAVNIADFLSQEIVTALTQDQDQKAILGDGTSTYANYTGWIPAMTAVSSNGMAVSASGNAWSAVTKEDWASVLAVMPDYALNSPNACWLINTAAYFSPFLKTSLGLGGAAFDSLANGLPQYRILGYPVIFSQVMQNVSASATVFALFGDF